MKRFFLIIAFVALAAFTLGSNCGVRPQPAPVPPKDTADCPAACEKLRALGCPEGDPLEDGTTCEEFCKNTQDKGHALRPSCVKDITKCSQVDECSKGNREIFE